MNTTSITTKIQNKLGAAQRAIRHLERSKALDDKEDAWHMFLNNLAQVSDALFKLGADPRAKSLIDQVISDQKSDPLLQYVFQARNSETHTFEPHVIPKRGGTTVSSPQKNITIDYMNLGGNHFYNNTFIDVEAIAFIESDDPRPEDVPIIHQRDGTRPLAKVKCGRLG